MYIKFNNQKSRISYTELNLKIIHLFNVFVYLKTNLITEYIINTIVGEIVALKLS